MNGIVRRASSTGRSARRVVASAALAVILCANSAARARTPLANAGQGEVVAKISLDAPTQKSFIVHATIPVPRNTYDGTSTDSPLTVLQPDGTAAPTQVEIVSRYPSAEHGADVVEVIARVDRPLGAVAGKRITYLVTDSSQPRGAPVLHPALEELLSTPGSVRLTTTDVFDNRYEADLLKALHGSGPPRPSRDGRLVREWPLHEILVPLTPSHGDQGTLPHMMGAHAWVRAFEDEPYLLVDLHMHNGLDGLDKTTPVDDALQEIYFRSLGLQLPPGWRVIHAFDSPSAGRRVRAEGGFEVHDLVKAQKQQDMYYMPKQAHFIRRLAIALPGGEKRARAALEARYLAFARRGWSPTSGDQLWSWWNEHTARFFPQSYSLPTLDHVGIHTIRQDLSAKLASRAEQLAEGRPGTYPMYEQRLGWAHPWGVPYGGMTGGDEIYQHDGMRTAAAGSRDGYRYAQLRMRAYMDRQPTALYSHKGQPTRVDDLLVQGPSGPYVTSTFFLLPKTGDPFGFEDAPTFQTEAVRAAGRDPSWEQLLSDYAPIDLQHYIRYSRNLKILAWLGNDSVAKFELEAAAEIFHMSFHEYVFDKWDYVQGNGLLARIERVEADPAEGLNIGRGEAWGLDAVAAAYAVGDDDYREWTYPWLQLVVRTFEGGQSSCTGSLMALQVYKLLPRYLIRRANESAYLENALRGTSESAFRGRDDALAERVDQMIVKSVRGGLKAPFWNPQTNSQWMSVGVSQLDFSEPVFCSNVPNDAYDDQTTKEHCWTGVAYAYAITGDPFFLKRAADLAETNALWEHFHEEGLDGLEARAPLLALLQKLHK